MIQLNWKTKLYLFAALIAILPGAFSSFNMINITKDELKSSRNTELNSITDNLANQINELYTNNWLAPLFYAKDGLKNPSLDASGKTSYLNAVIENSEDIISLSLLFEEAENKFSRAVNFNKDNFLESLAEEDFQELTSFSEESLIQLKLKDNFIGEPIYLPTSDLWVLDMMIPVEVPNAPPGFLAAKINLNNLRTTIDDHPFNQRGELFIVDKNKNLIFGKTESSLKENPVVGEAANILNTPNRVNYNSSFETNDGETVLAYCAFPLNIKWVIIAQMGEKTAYAAVSEMQLELIYWVIFGLGIAIITGLVFSRQLSKPITVLSEKAEIISGGNFDVTNDYKAKDEIGFLGNTLVSMAQSLKANFAKIEQQNKELEDYSHNLEDMVDERTKQLKDAQEKLIVQEKLASLGSLTAGIAHEIQNPLNFINNFGKLSVNLAAELKEEVERSKDKMDAEDYEVLDEIIEDLRTNTSKISEHGKRAERIVTGMLEHSRGDQGEFQDSDINSMLAESFNLAYHGTKSKKEDFEAKYVENFDKTLKKVYVNPQTLNRVFLNVINNGIYATIEKSKLNLPDYMPEIAISTKKTKEEVEITIRDNGTGMPESVKKKIFEPFFTTKPTGEGTGLGLSLSHDIIAQMHNGEFVVNSKEGEFTEFVIKLPLANKKK
ncbi:MAG: HAMP domain-containing protein [Melioribacteraceae bacterium]|nr:HAMP domain-containing protein [Melioribacteraceae bacterium]